jgi:hypothetical protein
MLFVKMKRDAKRLRALATRRDSAVLAATSEDGETPRNRAIR